MKLSNFASLDPSLRLRGVRGLAGASRLDRDVWNEFREDPANSITESEEKLRQLFAVDVQEEIEVSKRYGIQKRRLRTPPDSTESSVTVIRRRGQSYFRDLVLNNYQEQCAVSGISVRGLLVASHIVPWSVNPEARLDVRNGICLSRLHDAAFDCGLITFDDDFRLRLSSHLHEVIGKQDILAKNFGAFDGERLHIPANAFAPDPAFLAEHRRTIFQT